MTRDLTSKNRALSVTGKADTRRDLRMAKVGTHCLLELYDCPVDLLNDVAFLEQAVRDASSRGLASLLKQISHQFEPHGVTVLGLLAESHIALHTWPEHLYAAADVFTCGQTAQPQLACEYLAEVMQAKRHTLQHIERGTLASPAPTPVALT